MEKMVHRDLFFYPQSCRSPLRPIIFYIFYRAQRVVSLFLYVTLPTVSIFLPQLKGKLLTKVSFFRSLKKKVASIYMMRGKKTQRSSDFILDLDLIQISVPLIFLFIATYLSHSVVYVYMLTSKIFLLKSCEKLKYFKDTNQQTPGRTE